MNRGSGFEWTVVLAIVALAAFSLSPGLIVLAAGAVAIGVIVTITGRLALVGLETDVRIEPERVLEGERFVVVITIINRKPIPLPWLDVRLFLPEGLESASAERGVPRTWVNAGFAPGAHERIVLRAPIVAARRGSYAIGPLRLRGGDWLGFSTSEREDSVSRQIVVYPVPIAALDRRVPALRPLAETAVRRGLVPDPLRFRGVRPHRSGDPRKEIHWKASARLRSLQTKLYEPATSLDVIFLVNVASHEQYWLQADPEAVELVIAATAELVRKAATAGRQVGLVTNGLDNVTHERPRSALSRGPRSLGRTLEILARLGPYAANSPAAVFLAERGRLPWGASLIVVTPKIIAGGLVGALIALRRAHHRVLVVSVEAAPIEVVVHLRTRGIDVDTLREAELRHAV